MVGYKITAISNSLNNSIKNMQKKIAEIFGLKISGVQASKIVDWKAQSHNVNLTEKKLVEILGGKDE